MVEFKLTESDIRIYKIFKGLCRIAELTEFSSDDFRAFQLDKQIKNIGFFFAKMKHNKYFIEVGYTRSDVPSNKTRRVCKWRFNV